MWQSQLLLVVHEKTGFFLDTEENECTNTIHCATSFHRNNPFSVCSVLLENGNSNVHPYLMLGYKKHLP